MIPHKGENVPNGILDIFCHIGRTLQNSANYSKNDIRHHGVYIITLQKWLLAFMF